jgi:hypothetical protein
MSHSIGTNYKYGVMIDIDGSGGLGDEKFIPGIRHAISLPNFAAATVAQLFWTAPKACKIIRVYERHGTAAGQAGTLQIEKVPSGTAIGSGTVALATAIDLAGTANTNQKVSALTTAAAILAEGDSLATKLASGAATSLAASSLTVVIEWL